MFTGLVSDVGTIVGIDTASENWSMRIRTAYDTATLEGGESIAVDGACLTVTSIGEDVFTIDASPETLRKTTLGDRRQGDRVHLERALRLGDRLGGHLVLGHVDGVGTVRGRRREKNAWILDFEAPPDVAEFMIPKGSITVDGVSLTLNRVDGARFDVAIIPHTAEETNLGDYRPGRRVNLEADVLGKYVKKLLSGGEQGVSTELLERFGFTTKE